VLVLIALPIAAVSITMLWLYRHAERRGEIIFSLRRM
jgi:hypothetical protein